MKFPVTVTFTVETESKELAAECIDTFLGGSTDEFGKPLFLSPIFDYAQMTDYVLHDED